ncbi:hypothetical protein [Cardinium endosymbiont of Sogatella furcifera]|uniref:hypothetical protein n=1 Tax=Cardinium endosymbiont of Sogatella furcifera TaxID=650378 RepID=UPI0013B3E070|nr:hypothetical protein [Cardinium endosymbiont of Sogatella furcifera]
MRNNRFSRLIIVMCVACLLFTTACSRYTTSILVNHNGYLDLQEAVCYHSDGQLEVQCKTNGMCHDHFDWSTSNLCKVYDKKTTLCQVIEMGDIDLLDRLLGYIERDLIKYPPEKVIYLITGCGNATITGMKIPLLTRAVVKGDLDILKLLFAKLHNYVDFLERSRGVDVEALYQEVFCSRFGPGKFTLIQEAVNACDLAPEMVAYLIDTYTFLITGTARQQNQVAAWNRVFGYLLEFLSIKNKAGATPLDMAREYYVYEMPESAAPLTCLAQYGDPTHPTYVKQRGILFAKAALGNSNNFRAIVPKASQQIQCWCASVQHLMASHAMHLCEGSPLGRPIAWGDVPINRCKQQSDDSGGKIQGG